MFTSRFFVRAEEASSAGTPASQGPATQANQGGAPAGNAQPASPAPKTTFSSFKQRIATAKPTAQNQPQQEKPSEEPKTDATGAVEAKPPVAAAPVNTEAKQPIGELEVEVSGRKIKLDLSKPEVIAKKLYDTEAGMRKAFSERDQLKKQIIELEASKPDEEFVQKSTQFKKLVDDYTVGISSGNTFKAVDKLIDQLIPEETLNKWLQRKLQHHSYLMSASDEQKQAYLQQFQERESLEEDKYQVALDKAMIEAERTAKTSAEERAHAAEVQSLVSPAFDKHSFKNKPRLDKILWEESRAILLEKLNAGQDLTKELADSVFREVRASIDAEHNQTANERVAAAVSAKKDEAMTSIAQSAQGVGGGNNKDNPASLMQQGKRTQALISRFLQR